MNGEFSFKSDKQGYKQNINRNLSLYWKTVKEKDRKKTEKLKKMTCGCCKDI